MTMEELDNRIAAQKKAVESSQAQVTANGKTREADPWWTVTSAMTMSTVVLIFGFVILLLATYLIRTGKSSEAVLRIFGTILIIVIAVFLVVAGYTSDQISPVMGLLGTIAGYLLGKDSGTRQSPEAKRNETAGIIPKAEV